MPTRTYDPLNFANLYRGGSFKRDQSLPPVGVLASEGSFCPDSRTFFGATCRPGHFFDASPFGPWTVQDMIFFEFFDTAYNDLGGAYVYDGTWQDYTDARQQEWSDGLNPGTWLDAMFAPGVTLDVEPTMRHLDPQPDYALCIAYAPSTFWYGYNVGCDLGGQGCGAYQLYQPYVELNAFGVGPYVDPRLDYSPMNPTGFANGDPGPGSAVGTPAGEDPDPMIVNPGGWAYSDSDHPEVLVPSPLPNGYQLVGRAVAMGGVLRPPTPGYTPNANSTEPGEALDALNTGAKELWAWDDVKALAAQFNYGAGGQWYKVGWGANTANFGTAHLVVHPYWLREPLTTPQLHGRIEATPVASHIRRVRGGRTGHTI